MQMAVLGSYGVLQPRWSGEKKKKINRLDTTNDLQNGGEKKTT